MHSVAAGLLDRLVVAAEVLDHLDNVYLTRLSLEVAEAGERTCLSRSLSID